MKLFLTLFMMLFVTGTYAEELLDFPRQVSFTENGKEYHLKITGVATRKKFFVKVYNVAHYLQEGASNKNGDKFALILQDDLAKQLTLKWMHTATVAQVADGYQESFKNVFSEEQLARLKGQIGTFVQFFNRDVQKGDEQIIRWLPGGTIEVLINGTRAGQLSDKEFAIGLWSIWFGPKSVVNRDQLVSLLAS